MLRRQSGVLVVSTDDEEAVGNVFSRLQIGKDVRVSKAPPQGQAMNGSAERSFEQSRRILFVCQKNCECRGLQSVILM